MEKLGEFIILAVRDDCDSSKNSCAKPTTAKGWQIALSVLIPVLVLGGGLMFMFYKSYKKNKVEERSFQDKEEYF